MISKWTWITAAACLIIIALSVFASGLLKPLGHDENMYCTAGVLMAQGELIYRDFSYVTHPPAYPLLLATVYRIFDITRYLLVARVVSIVCDWLIAVIIFFVYLRAFNIAPKEGVYLGLGAVFLYTFNPFVNYAGGFAWNHSIVMLCVAASFWLYITMDNQISSRYLRIVGIAALLTFATFSRATTSLIWLVFFCFILLESNQPAGQRLKSVGVFLFASFVVSLCPLYIIAQAPKAFYLDVVINPLLNGRYLHQIEMAYSKSQMIWNVLTEPVYGVTVLIGICLCLAAFINRKSFSKIASRNMKLAVLLTIVSFIIALLPLTVWQQYFAMPILFLIMSLAYPATYFAGGKHLRFVSIAAAGVGIFPIIFNISPLAAIPVAYSVSNWVPMQVHSIAQDIAAKAGKGNRVLTLAPLFAIEGGCKIYPELSAGPFAYRVADSMSAKARAIAKVVGPMEIAELARKLPTSAVFVGTEPAALEEPLRRVAPPDWKKQTYLDGRLTLFYSNSNR
jgi:hypothetical protein